MAFGDDREYARSGALPDWLRNFVDEHLKKGGDNTFEDIKNLFQNKSDLDSVEARVSELREQVGLDTIEKVATGEKDKIPGGKAEGQPNEKYDEDQLGKGVEVETEHTPDREVAKEIAKDHLEESEDFKDGEGAKYYDKLEDMEKEIEKEKKASRIKQLIALANALEAEGDIEAAMEIDKEIYIVVSGDKHLSKEAIKWYSPNEPTSMVGQEKSYKLPPGAGTMLDPMSEEDLWNREKARSIETKPEPKVEEESPRTVDINPKKVPAWYILMAFGHGFGWYKNKKDAEAAEFELVADFAHGLMATDSRPMLGELFKEEVTEKWDELKLKNPKAAHELTNFLVSTSYVFREEREFAVAEALQIFDVREEGFTPSYVLGEDEHPSGDYQSVSKMTLGDVAPPGSGFRYKNKALAPFIKESVRRSRAVIDYLARWAEERVAASANDFYISSRAAQEAKDKKKTPKALEKHPKLETFIRNVCRTRGGHIELPAIQTMLRNERPEDVDVTDKDLTEFIKECLKEYREEMEDDGDEHAGEYVAIIQPDDDDGNKEVFNEPPTII
jgi:hypothetical protein